MLKYDARLAGRRMSEVQLLDCEPICAKNSIKGDPQVMDELFEIGKDYVFYFYYGNKTGFQHIGGQIVSYEHPLVKIETAGLLRVINCASSSFIEAVSRNQNEELEELGLEKDSV
jgi:hypothetical protein